MNRSIRLQSNAAPLSIRPFCYRSQATLPHPNRRATDIPAANETQHTRCALLVLATGPLLPATTLDAPSQARR